MKSIPYYFATTSFDLRTPEVLGIDMNDTKLTCAQGLK